MKKHWRIITAAVVIVGIAILTLHHHYPGRSVANYCEAYKQEKATITQKFGGSTWGLTSLIRLVQLPGDMIAMFKHLERVAPDEIHDDVTTIRETMEEQIKTAAEHPGLGGMVGSMAIGFKSMPAWEAVGQYTQANCEPEAESHLGNQNAPARTYTPEEIADARDTFNFAVKDMRATLKTQHRSNEDDEDGGRYTRPFYHLNQNIALMEEILAWLREAAANPSAYCGGGEMWEVHYPLVKEYLKEGREYGDLEKPDLRPIENSRNALVKAEKELKEADPSADTAEAATLLAKADTFIDETQAQFKQKQHKADQKVAKVEEIARASKAYRSKIPC
jgi:hypothetical protein